MFIEGNMSNKKPEWMSGDSAYDMSVMEDVIKETDQAEAADEGEKALTPTFAQPIARPETATSKEVKLERYQQEMRDRIPGLIGKILSSEYQPAPRRSGHRINGELGRKGNRGL